MNKNIITGPAGKFELSKDGTYIVAEAGINHNGDLGLAKVLVDIAADTGCNAVKFQKRTPHLACIGREDEPCDSPWGTTLLEKYEGRELTFEECCKIGDYAAYRGIHCFWSYWDIDALHEFSPYFSTNIMTAIKIPSARMHDYDLLQYVARVASQHRIPVFLGTGMCTAEDVTKAGRIFTNTLVVYMQCTSSYPCKAEDIHLDVMAGWQAQARKVGYSGHEMGYIPTLAAVARGVLVVERHITFDKKLTGTDQHLSLEPDELKAMVNAIREIEATRGSLVKEILPCEAAAIERLQV